MAFEFTPAGQRVLAAASQWRLNGPADDIGPVELLLGLLAEPEYRAAGLLAGSGIDERAVHSRWPTIRPSPTNGASHPRLLSATVESSLYEVFSRLNTIDSFPLATEHILLGLTLGDDDVAAWLSERRLASDSLTADIRKRYGIVSEPINLDADDPPIPLAETVSPDSLITYEDERDAGSDSRRLRSGLAAGASSDTGAAATPTTEAVILRILDAAANRAGEAVRVVEDYARFALDDRFLTRLCKELRHELAAVLRILPAGDRLAMRDVSSDVGTTIATAAEMHRGGLADVAAANFRRLQESLRSLEEYGKVVNAEMAARCEQFRYRSYTLEKAAAAVAGSLAKLGYARLYVLVDGGDCEAAFAAKARTLIEAGVDIVQLRDKRLDDRSLLSRARHLRQLTRGSATLFIMNDRPDLAALAEADGVHVGQEEMSVGDARRIIGPNRLIGVSTHSIEQARQAVLDGADYLGVGPVFPSRTKEFRDFPGLDLVRAVAAEIRLPAFAIGGITRDNIAQVREAGLSRAAVSGAIDGAPDIFAAIGNLRAALSD